MRKITLLQFKFIIGLIFGFVSLNFAQNVGDVAQNYGFEDGVGADNVPTGCSFDDYNGNGSFVLDQTVFHSGAASGLLKGTDANAVSLDSYLPNIASANKGDVYSLSIWIKTDMTDGVIAIQDYSFALYEEHEVTATDWTEYTAEFSAAETGNSGVSIGFYGSGKVWIDDCVITLTKKVYNIGDILQVYGFEDGVDAGNVPTGCSLDDYNGNAEFILDETIYHTGGASGLLKAQDNASEVSLDSYLPNIDGVEKGATYSYSVWLKADVTSGEFAVQIVPQWDYYGNDPAVTDWVEYTGTFEAAKDGESGIAIGLYGTGKIWIDDVTITKLTEAPPAIPNDVVANPSFELPNEAGDSPINWQVEAWGSGSTEIGFVGNDTARYIWDNTVSHTGEYSGKIQVTQADIDQGSMDAGWRTQTLEFLSGGIYELKYWAKTANFAKGNRFRISIGYNNVDLTQILVNSDWVEVKDTILFPTDQDENGWRNQMRFRLSGPAIADTMAEAWVDDVNFTLLGMQALQLDSVVAIRQLDNSVKLTWPVSKDVTGATYHILMQPTSINGIFEKNLLNNPGFETPNSDGSAPQDWTFQDFANGTAAAAVGEWPAAETYSEGGDFSVYVGEMTAHDGVGIKARWYQTYERSKLSRSQAYLYGAIVKYSDVVPNQDPILSDIHPAGQYYNSGVNIWYDRSEFEFQNTSLLELGFSTPIGTSEGWEMVSFPIVYDQAQTRHRFGIGIGQLAASYGNAYIDNTFVVPFDVVGSTSATTYTIENVPADVKYFAVYVEDGSGSLIASPAKITVDKSSLVAVEDTQLPVEFSLEQNYPNPFNPSTTIKFGLKVDSDVSLKIFNILGQEVTTLINKKMKAGYNNIQFNSANLSSGVYFYRMEANGVNGQKFVSVKKMMFLK
ncbi:MAG: T9SS type A sorting domain-containing protein [Ignavibacteriae bacterium]|nr:T9SS type A sorting domain-containing protein [Ignavibacteriota bacterium]